MERFFKRKEPSSGPNFVDLNNLPWDPADRIRILDYHPDQRDEIRRKYWINGPCQPRGHDFPPTIIGNKDRHFNRDWFDKYGNWLEYSVKADKAFFLSCYLFADSVGNQGGRDAFIKEGFSSWNKPERLATHVGDFNSAHNKALKKCNDLLNQKQSIATALHKQDDIVKRANRLRLNATIDDIRLCLKEALAFRAHDESKTSLDKENFLEIMAVIVKHDKELRELPKAAGNNQYLSPLIQKDIAICFEEEVINSILKEIKSAYYIHCFAHQLQLVIVHVAKKHLGVVNFFDNLSILLNVVCSSCKRTNILRDEEKERVEKEIGSGILETGSGLNQELSFIRPGDTRWNSHYKTLVRLVNMFQSIIKVLEYVRDECIIPSSQNQAINMINFLDSFEFAFYLHLMLHILGLTDILSRALQKKDQDILEAVLLVETTKEKLQEFRENGFDRLLAKVESFCEKNDIQIPNMIEEYVNDRAKRRRYNITYQHYYKVDCFNTVVDMQIQEFGDRFSEISTELLRHVPALNPRDSFAMFDASKLMRLSEFYPYDFNEEEKVNLESQLEVYIASVRKDERFANLNGIADLARVMVETRKHVYFPLIYRLLKLVLVLPVATATVERCFSALKIVKTSLRNRIGEEFLNACVICSVEKETLESITNEVVIDRFQKMKPRRGQL